MYKKVLLFCHFYTCWNRFFYASVFFTLSDIVLTVLALMYNQLTVDFMSVDLLKKMKCCYKNCKSCF